MQGEHPESATYLQARQQQIASQLHDVPHLRVPVDSSPEPLGAERRQPRAAAALVRDFPGRVLFGTNTFPPDPASLREHFRFFETADECYALAQHSHLGGRWPVSSLDLDGAALASLYSGAARSLIPGLG